jgi:hypothetical protein
MLLAGIVACVGEDEIFTQNFCRKTRKEGPICSLKDGIEMVPSINILGMVSTGSRYDRMLAFVNVVLNLRIP